MKIVSLPPRKSYRIARKRLKTAPRRRVRGKSGTKARPKLKSLSKLKRELDRVFSIYQRRRFADKNGMVKSYTGNEVKHWMAMHNGHYITRACLALRWNLNNTRPQSPAENIWKHGNPIEFRINLCKEIGEEAVKELEARRKDLFKPSRVFYEEQIAYYTELINELPT